MIFKPSKIINDFINNYKLKIVISDKLINRVNIVKYLGLYIDENLTWSEHIKQLTSKLSSLIGIIFRKRYIIPNNCKRNIYFALAYSHLIYCIEIYGKAKVSVLNPLVTKCNALLRILQNKPRLSSTKDLYTSYNTLPINLLYKLAILNFMHRIIYNPHNTPVAITNLFHSNSSTHQHNTRHKHEFHIHSSVCKSSLVHRYGLNS